MKFSSVVISIVALTLCWSACKKDPEIPVIFVLPGGLNIPTFGGELIEFDVDAIAGDNPLTRITIVQKPVNGLTSTLLDTTIAGTQASFFYIYQVPAGDEDIVLTFTVIDTEGYQGQTARRLAIQGNNFLPESTGHSVYSAYSNAGNDAFNLDDATVQFTAADPDSMLVDIVEFDTSDDGEPGLAWTSLSGTEFVRNNSFNYPEATLASAESTFDSSTPVEIITALAEEDILVAKYEVDSAVYSYAVIKITAINNDAGSDDDRYVFNLKK